MPILSLSPAQLSHGTARHKPRRHSGSCCAARANLHSLPLATEHHAMVDAGLSSASPPSVVDHPSSIIDSHQPVRASLPQGGPLEHPPIRPSVTIVKAVFVVGPRRGRGRVAWAGDLATLGLATWRPRFVAREQRVRVPSRTCRHSHHGRMLAPPDPHPTRCHL